MPTNSVVAASIPAGPQLLEYPDQGEPVTLRLPGVRRKHLVQLIDPRTDLGQRLDGAFIGQFGDPGPDHLAHGVPRDTQLAADFLDLLLLLEKGPTNLRNRLHDQHPTLCSPMISGASSPSV